MKTVEESGLGDQGKESHTNISHGLRSLRPQSQQDGGMSERKRPQISNESRLSFKIKTRNTETQSCGVKG